MTTPKDDLRTEHRRQQHEMILDAAREIFVAEGYQALSMRRLADRIGCSPGTIYSYFENKSDLVHSLVEESFAALGKRLDATIGDAGDPIARLKARLLAYHDFGLENPNHYHFAFMLRRDAREGPLKPHRAFHILRDAVGACRRAGHFRNVDTETASQVLWTAIHGVTSLSITHASFPWVDRRELVSRVVDGAIAGLEGHPVSAGDDHENDDPRP